MKAFIRNIVTNKNNPMYVEHWTTKVEFHGRGAGHNHGTIWVDMNKMEFIFLDDEGKWSDLNILLKLSSIEILDIKSKLKTILNSYFVDGSVIEGIDASTLYKIYCQIFQTEEDQANIESDPNNFVNNFYKDFHCLDYQQHSKSFRQNRSF